MPQHIIKTYNLQQTEPGMQIAKMVLTDTGKLALDAGTILTASLIERLKDWGVETVDILLPCSEEEIIVEGTEEPGTVNSPVLEEFCESYSDTVDEIKTSFSAVRFLREIPILDLTKLVGENIETLVDTTGVVNHLHMVKRQDDYTFHHSVNVAVISGVMGKWLGYNGQELKDLILAGLMHDIGKTQIPLEILNKPGKLTESEMEIMKLHTVRGYQLISKLDLPQGVIYGVLQHHERIDGSGYPLKLKSEKIHDYAKIIAIADIYDAMTSDRVYREKVSPFAVVEMIVSEMYNKLDPNYCMAFLNNVRDYFLGNIILLSTGQEAEVVYLGQVASARPVIRTTDGIFIDLESRKDISIVKLIKS